MENSIRITVELDERKYSVEMPSDVDYWHIYGRIERIE